MAQAAVIDKCDFCDSAEDVHYFCTNCDELLCSKCKVGHARSKKTRNDRIIPLSQARKDGILRQSMTVFCSEHFSIEVTLFCLKCNQLVCTRCLAGKHNTHRVIIPDEIRDNKTVELRDIIKTLKEKKAVFENAFDIEGKIHNQFSKSIDQVRIDITNQKAKIIEELDLLCEEQFSELKILQQNEDKRYSDACSEIQVQNQAVTMAIQTAETSITSSNSCNIIQATFDTTQTLQGLGEPDIPPTTVATYEQGDKTRPSILQVQGKINIKQTPTVMYQHQKQDINKLKINTSKVKVKSTLEVKSKDEIFVIVPLQNKTAWVQADSDRHLTLIDSRGKIITKSVSLGYEIFDAKQYRNGLLVTCNDQCIIHSLSIDGKSTSTFSDLSPYKTRGLCVTHEMEVVVCLYIPNIDNKVVRLNTSGHIIQTLQHDVKGAPLYKDPYRVASLTTGEVIVVDRNKIVGVDREGSYLFTWEGDIQGMKLDNYSLECITQDSNNNLLVTDYWYHRIFVLGKDGSEAICLLDSTREIDGPHCIAVDDAGKLWIGGCCGNIYVIEY